MASTVQNYGAVTCQESFSKQAAKDKVSDAAQKCLQKTPATSSRSHIFHYIAGAALGVLAVAAVVAFVFFPFPLLIVAAFALSILAVLMLIEGFDKHHENNGLKAAPKKEVDPAAVAEQVIAKTGKDESGEFAPEELGRIGRDREGRLSPFKDFFDTYPYRMTGTKPEEGVAYQETLFRSYVKRVLGLAAGQDPLERVQECLEMRRLLVLVPIALGLQSHEEVLPKLEECLNGEDTHIRRLVISLLGEDEPLAKMKEALEKQPLVNKALQLHAFFKLVGNKNTPMPQDPTLNGTLIQDHHIAFDSVPTQTGRMIPFLQSFGDGLVTFKVADDQVALYPEAKFLGQESQPLATFRAGRQVMIFPPDHDGTVRYAISRNFSRVPQIRGA